MGSHGVDSDPRPTELAAAATAPVDVFLSYSSADRPLVERVARRLRRHGVEPWFDRWNLTPGGPWQDEIAEGLQRSSACAVFLGPGDLGAWTRIEMSVALRRAADERSFRLFPVLLPGLEPFEPSDLPPFLAVRTWVDMRDGPDSDRPLQDLINAVHGVPYGPDVPAAGPAGPAPYRGLEPFDEEHARFFFGREAAVQRMAEKLRHSRFLAVVGPSGSGKSSLVRAGLLPRVRAGGAGPGAVRVLVLRPGADPLAALAGRLRDLDPTSSLSQVVDRLAADERTVHLTAAAALADEPPECRVLIVVDQCEELFTVCRDEAQRTAFLAALHYASMFPDGRTAVILTLRADFYARLTRFPQVAQLVQAHQMLVGGLTDDELRQVIEEPARVVGLEVESGLADTILGDVVREPGTLPLLEHALLETWHRRRGTTLTLQGYRETGGVRRGLAERAENVFGALDPRCQDVARRLLLRLTQPGEGTGDTRRRASRNEVSTGPDGALVDDVVGRLVDARLLTTAADDVSGEEWVEVSHEALIRGWPRLQGWIDADRAGLLVHRRLTAAAQEWQRLGRDAGALYRGGHLAEAMAWRERQGDRLNQVEDEFLRASEKAENAARTARRRRVGVAFVALTAALALISVVALVAVERGREATQQRDVALSRQLAASAVNALMVDPSLALALALRAADTARTTQAEEVLRRATAEARGTLVLRVDTGPVLSARFLPGQHRIASIGEDGQLRIWDLDTRQAVTTVPVHASRAYQVRPSPDGRRVATVGHDGVVAVTDLATAASRVLLRAPDGVFARSVAFSPDGRLLAASLSNGTVRVLDSVTGAGSVTVQLGDQPVNGVAFSPDGRLLAVAGAGGAAELVPLSDPGRPLPLRGHDGNVFDIEFSSGGDRVITAGEDGTVRLWGAATGGLLETVPVSAQAIYGATLSVNGDRFVTAGQDGVVGVWATDGIALASLRGHAHYAFDATFDSTGNSVLSAGDDGTIRTWALEPSAAVAARVTGAAFSPDGNRVLAGGADGHVRLWSGDRLTPQLDLAGGTARNVAAFSGDGRRIAEAAPDGTVRVRDANDGRVLTTLHPNEGPVWAVALDGHGDQVATGGQDSTVVLSPLAGGPPRRLEGHTGTVYCLVFGPDGHSVVSGSADGTVRLWHDDGRVQIFRGHQGTVVDVAVSRDGSRLASAGADGTVRIWDPTRQQVALLRGHDGSANAVRFSPDGTQVVSAGDDGTVRVWDIGSQRLLLTLPLYRGAASTADFGPDGRTILSASEIDRVVRTSRCDVCGSYDEVLTLARSRPPRILTPDEVQRWVS